MDNPIQSNNSSADLKARITEHIKELAEATDAARMSEAMLKYLDMAARFHRYSPCNVWLILMAKPDATMVAGFQKWKSMKRYVRRGERGIAILAPIFTTITNQLGEEEERLMGFKVVFVFDLSQTEGEPLPEPPDWKSPEKNAELQERLVRFAERRGIRVEVKHIGHDIQGVSTGGRIILDPEAGTKTLIHEMAHEMLHQGIELLQTNPALRELEAESVAYIVAKHFGLNGLASPNYVALHGADSAMILDHLERIRCTAVEIISALDSISEA